MQVSCRKSLCLTKHQPWRHTGDEGIVSQILDVGTRRMCVVSFTPQPLYPGGKIPGTLHLSIKTPLTEIYWTTKVQKLKIQKCWGELRLGKLQYKYAESQIFVFSLIASVHHLALETYIKYFESHQCTTAAHHAKLRKIFQKLFTY